MIGEDSMEYDLKAMDFEIRTIEEGTKRLRELGRGFEAVERNTEAILAFTYILRKNISDIFE